LRRRLSIGPRSVDSRLLLGAVGMGLFVSTEPQLPVSPRVDCLHGSQSLVSLENDVALVVRSTLLTTFQLPDTVVSTPRVGVFFGLGVVQGEHPVPPSR